MIQTGTIAGACRFRLLIAKHVQLCRAGSRRHVHRYSSPVRIDIIFRPQCSFWKPVDPLNALLKRLFGSLTNKNTMVNSVTEESTKLDSNGCSNGSMSELSETHICEEVIIPLPWGNLAAKVWGRPNDNPILALHGWQDNAGTFDKLVPLLPNDFYIVCLDFSGHGFSDHYPPGLMYHYWDKITDIRLVAEHFGWKRFSMIGHSMGGIVASMFTAVAPDLVDRLVMIDIVKPISTPPKHQPDRSSKAIESYIQILKKLEQGPPCYTYEVARERLVQANNGSIDAAAAEILMRRGAKKNEDGTGYYFTRDLRLVIPTMASYTAEQHAEYAKRVRCPLLILTAKNGFIYEDRSIINDFINIYREVSLGGFECVEVEGTHHVHLVNPENVAPHVAKFFSRAAMPQ